MFEYPELRLQNANWRKYDMHDIRSGLSGWTTRGHRTVTGLCQRATHPITNHQCIVKPIRSDASPEQHLGSVKAPGA